MKPHTILLMATALFSSTVLAADDLDQLKAASQATVEALNARDVDAFLETLHDEEVAFLPWDAFASDYKGQLERRRESVTRSLGNTEMLRITPVGRKYRIIDDTGLIWGHVKVESKAKDGPYRVQNFRGTWVYEKSEQGWKLVMRHLSPIPDGN